MVSISDIVRSNTETFFDHRIGVHKSIKPRIAFQIALSLILTVLFYRNLPPFVSGVITVQAILLGFSFSAMFFLMSSGNEWLDYKGDDDASLERKNLRNQAVRVSREIFSNIAYFNLVCLACLGVSLALMLPPISTAISAWEKYIPATVAVTAKAFHYLGYAFWLSSVASFYFLLTECAYTFFRISARMNFLFNQKVRSL